MRSRKQKTLSNNPSQVWLSYTTSSTRGQRVFRHFTPVDALKLVQCDPELCDVNETLKRDYSEHLLNQSSTIAKLNQLRANVLNNRPYHNRRTYLTGPKFERAVQDILTIQNKTPELQIFIYRTLQRERRAVARLDLLWLKQHFRFPNDVIAHHLDSGVRQVARIVQLLKSFRLQFRQPRSSTHRPVSFAPLQKKPQFDRSLSRDEHKWIDDVEAGRAIIKLDGQEATGPEAARALKYVLHRDKDKDQYDAWVDSQRLIGHASGSKPYDPDWLPHPDGKAFPDKRKNTSLPIEDEEEGKAQSYLTGLVGSRARSTYQPRPNNLRLGGYSQSNRIISNTHRKPIAILVTGGDS